MLETSESFEILKVSLSLSLKATYSFSNRCFVGLSVSNFLIIIKLTYLRARWWWKYVHVCDFFLQLNFYSYHFRFRTMKFLPFCLVFAFLLMTSTVLGESETLRETDKTRHYTSRVYKLYHTYLKDVASKNRFQKYQSKPVIKEHEQPLF